MKISRSVLFNLAIKATRFQTRASLTGSHFPPGLAKSELRDYFLSFKLVNPNPIFGGLKQPGFIGYDPAVEQALIGVIQHWIRGNLSGIKYVDDFKNPGSPEQAITINTLKNLLGEIETAVSNLQEYANLGVFLTEAQAGLSCIQILIQSKFIAEYLAGFDGKMKNIYQKIPENMENSAAQIKAMLEVCRIFYDSNLLIEPDQAEKLISIFEKLNRDREKNLIPNLLENFCAAKTSVCLRSQSDQCWENYFNFLTRFKKVDFVKERGDWLDILNTSIRKIKSGVFSRPLSWRKFMIWLRPG